jgi:hypothetical protein
MDQETQAVFISKLGALPYSLLTWGSSAARSGVGVGVGVGDDL